MSISKNRINEKISGLGSYLKSWVTTFNGGLTIFCLIILIVLPIVSISETVFLRTLSLALIFCVFAASWDFLTGIAGQVSFGHAIFFGIAGYLCAFFVKYAAWVESFIFLSIALFFCLAVVLPKKNQYLFIIYLFY